MKSLLIPIEDKEHQKLTKLKGKLTWYEFLIKDKLEDKQ